MSAIDIVGKRTLDYIPDALARFNRGMDHLVIRAISGNASKAMEIAHILNVEFGIEVDRIEMKPHGSGDKVTYCIEVTLKASAVESRRPAQDYSVPPSGFVDFPAYHLLLDWCLFSQGKLELVHDGARLITINQDGAMDYDTHSMGVRNALYRCGHLWPSNWQEIAKKLVEFDDVILGIDTNILYNCTISEHLLPALSLTSPQQYASTPNWILFVIPSSVMHELEEAANLRHNDGSLEPGGRMGFRALQEVVELNQNIDIPGVSLLVVGKANPILDTRTELQRLRADIHRSQQGAASDGRGSTVRWSKPSSGDMIIRGQFKDFLRQLDFHKGAFFLTADKSNAAMARAEGLCPIYVRPPLKMYDRVPIGKLVYEMAVEFRSITIKLGDQNMIAECDCKGETIDCWVCRRLKIQGFDRLLHAYQGKASLKKVTAIWNKLVEEFVGLEE